jgi:hypothetical protein
VALERGRPGGGELAMQGGSIGARTQGAGEGAADAGAGDSANVRAQEWSAGTRWRRGDWQARLVAA